MIHVIAQPNPVTGELFQFDLPGGVKYHLGDILCEVVHHTKCPIDMLKRADIFIGEADVTHTNYLHIYPKDGTTVLVRSSAQGDFGQLFLNIASVALMIAAPELGPVIAGVRVGTLALRIGISLVTAVLNQALFKPNGPKLSKGNDLPSSAQASITGIANQAIPYGAVPKIYGRIKNYHPPYGGIPYAEIVGKVQRLRTLFLVGYGTFNITDERIGTSPLANFKEISVQKKYGAIDTDELSLYPSRVNQENLSIRLKQDNGWSMRTTPANTQEIRLDYTFPQGLVNITSKNINQPQEVAFSVQYRVKGTSTWIDPPVLPSSSFIVGNTDGHFRVRNFRRDIFRVAVEWTVPSGTYEVRTRRDSADDLSDKEGKDQTQSFDMSLWTALTCLNNDTLINIDDCTLIAMKILADDQLNGNIDTYNFTAEAKIPTRRSDGSVTAPVFTQTPAWEVIDVLQGNASITKIPDVRINLDSFIGWADWTDGEKRYCDAVFNNIGTVRNTINAIASTGRGLVNVIDNVYTAVYDKRQTTIKGHYSGASVKNFRIQRAMPDIPDAIVVRYPSAKADQQTAEIMAFNTGFSKSTAVNIDVMDSPFATDAKQAREDGYLILAEGKFRPDAYSFESPRAHIRNTQGDLIRVQHDVPRWGIGGGLIDSVVVDGSLSATGLNLNFTATMVAGTSYCVRIATADGGSVYKNLTTVPGTSQQVLFKVSESDADGTYEYAQGDLVMYGEAQRESVEVLIRSIKPQSDGTATVICSDASYDEVEAWIKKHRDLGFEADITTPPTSTPGTPPSPEILSIGSDERYLQQAADGTLTPAMSVSVSPANGISTFVISHIQVRFRPVDSGEGEWQYVTVGAGGNLIILCQPVTQGAAYEVEARAITELGNASDWSGTELHTIVGKSGLPADVPDLFMEDKRLVWSYPDPALDVKGFVVKYHYADNSNWLTATLATPTAILTKSFDLANYLEGQMTWMVKAVDDSDNESLNPVILQYNFGDRPIANIAETLDIAASGFTGTKDYCSVAGGHLKADAQSDASFWSSDDSAPFWAGDSDPFWFSTVYEAMSYIHEFAPDAAWLGTGSILLNITVNTPPYTIEYRLLEDAPFWAADGAPFWAASDSDPFWVVGNPTEWRTFAGAITPITHSIVQLKLTWLQHPTQVDISALSLTIDVPDIVIRYDDVAISNTGTFIGAGDFNVIKYFTYSLQADGGTANNVVFDKPFVAANGVKAYTRNVNTLVAGTIDAVIGGY